MSIPIRNHCDGWGENAPHYHKDIELITVGWGRLCPACRRAWQMDQQLRALAHYDELIPVDAKATEA